MAFTINELNTVSKKFFDKTITQQVYEDSPFFAKLKDDGQVITEGGITIQWPARVAKLQRAKATGPRAKVDFGSNETRAGADIPWCYYDADTMIHWDERNKNAGPGKIVDLAKDRAEELLQDIKDLLYAELFATTYVDGTNIVPLATIVDAADTYAGITVAQAAQWAGQEDSSTTAMSLYGAGSLSKLRNDATFGTKGPTLHITTRDLWSKYESKLSPAVRYEDKQMSNLGFDSITFHKKPVVADVFCTANYWYGLDMSCFELRVHKDDNMNVTDWFELKQAGYVRALAKYVSWVGNLLARRRRTSFKFSDLNYEL